MPDELWIIKFAKEAVDQGCRVYTKQYSDGHTCMWWILENAGATVRLLFVSDDTYEDCLKKFRYWYEKARYTIEHTTG